MTTIDRAPRSARHLFAAAALGVLLVAAGLGLYRAATGDGPPDEAARAEQLGSRLRCPTCQGLAVADSPSPWRPACAT